MSAPLRRAAAVARLHALHRVDRLRLGLLRRRCPGFSLHPDAGSSFALARFALDPTARLRIAAGAATERRPGWLSFSLGRGAEVEIGERCWLRTEVGPIHIVAFEGARIEIGPDALLNGCHLSAKQRLTLGRRVSIGVGSRVFDSDQHDLDDARPETSEPVEVGDYSWIASDVTILRGVNIGAHCVIGSRSLVTGDVPDHTLAFGIPARPRGTVGDRSRAR